MPEVSVVVRARCGCGWDLPVESGDWVEALDAVRDHLREENAAPHWRACPAAYVEMTNTLAITREEV